MVLGFLPLPGKSIHEGSCNLGPLQQRLMLYGFAWLQIDPFARNSEEFLSIAGLQLLAGGSDREDWLRLLPGAAPYSEFCSYPVISPSLSALKRIRAVQPNRALIFVQTAYESPPGPRALSALIGDRPALARRLHPADPFRTLRLFRPVALDSPRIHAAWEQFPRHPMADFMDHAVRADPHSRFWPQEDGTILQQRDLFHPDRALPDFLMRRLPEYDKLFLEEIARIPSGAYVLASGSDALEWFRADCVRLLGKDYCCWEWPAQGDKRDPSKPLILAHDGLIAFSAMDRDLPVVHLDGSERELLFRMLRKRKPAPLAWRPKQMGDCLATWNYFDYRLSFSHHQDGWFCADGQTNGADGDLHFARYLETLEELGV